MDHDLMGVLESGMVTLEEDHIKGEGATLDMHMGVADGIMLLVNYCAL